MVGQRGASVRISMHQGHLRRTQRANVGGKLGLVRVGAQGIGFHLALHRLSNAPDGQRAFLPCCHGQQLAARRLFILIARCDTPQELEAPRLLATGDQSHELQPLPAGRCPGIYA